MSPSADGSTHAVLPAEWAFSSQDEGFQKSYCFSVLYLKKGKTTNGFLNQNPLKVHVGQSSYFTLTTNMWLLFPYILTSINESEKFTKQKGFLNVKIRFFSLFENIQTYVLLCCCFEMFLETD